ncbi:hypothetical protein BDU57DRAFT_514208 [Ampelomyces quisqualis]|uniref:Uncharacterized protein n=1 Tax=Ampelomyces quisqualis TaxID=50730 RepID=A0A6A5QQU4_AMPQU|nr:hypothetical protein BDU57DRAFT_514208 [Ampelomyces quisqualis]
MARRLTTIPSVIKRFQVRPLVRSDNYFFGTQRGIVACISCMFTVVLTMGELIGLCPVYDLSYDW